MARVWREARALAAAFGAMHTAYAARVGALVPGMRWSKRLEHARSAAQRG